MELYNLFEGMIGDLSYLECVLRNFISRMMAVLSIRLILKLQHCIH